MDSEFLTAGDLAAWLKIKMPTVRRWAREGLPCLRAGRLCRYRKDLVEAWLVARAELRQQGRKANGQRLTVSDEASHHAAE